MILVGAHRLEKGFAGRTLFQNISFGIHQGERIGLLGPNGAGKSTLLKILARRQTADAGEVIHRNGLSIGYLEQDPVFEPGAQIMQSLLGNDPSADMYDRSYEMLSRLELSRFGEDFPVERLSGGWKKRLALGRELLRAPELLLLDEPTNHLDVQGVMWLEDFLVSSNLTFLAVTHDRLFLQRIANRILDLDKRNPDGLISIEGGYLAYLEHKNASVKALQAQEQRMKNTLRRETEWLQRGAIARLKKQKARQDSAHAMKDDVAEITEKNRRQSVGLDFGDPARTPKKLIEAEAVAKSFNGQTLFEDFSFILGQKSRVALLGANGAGKTTLIKILLGLEEPDTGKVKRYDELLASYFEQSRDKLDPNLTVRQNLSGDGDYVDFQGKYVHVGSYMDRFLFRGERGNTPVSKLSGGERARLRIAQLMTARAQVLVLDEPTNDLDTETLDVLEDALAEFPGAVILVTHDRYFMDAVSDTILALPDPGDEEKKIISYADYFQWERAREADGTKTPAPKNSGEGNGSAKAGKNARLGYKEKLEFEQMEEKILALEAELTSLQTELDKPEVASNHQRLLEVNTRMGALQTEIEKKYARWTELEARAAKK